VYYEHFGLNDAPFKIIPDPHLFFSGGERGLVLDALVYAILNGEGIIKVVGEVGSGKTMLCRMLPVKLPQHVEILYLANPRLTPDTILQAIALEMNLPISRDNQANHLQVMQALHEALLHKHSQNIHVVLLIEEAQGMPIETLEEIRLVSNLETTRNKLLQVVLFGQPELDENLSQVHIRQLKERITHSFHLQPLSRAEIAKYLDFRLRVVGYRGGEVFSKGSIKVLHKASEGLLRRVNILADKALLACFSENTHTALARHVRMAAIDSQLPPRKTGQSHTLLLSLFLLFLLALGGVFAFKYMQLLNEANIKVQVVPTLPAATPPESIPPPDSIPEETPEIIVPIETVETIASKPKLEPVFKIIYQQPKIKNLNSVLEKRLAATQKWLKTVDNSHYSIQLLQTDYAQDDKVENFLATTDIKPLLPQIYLYASTRQANAHWGVLWGTFTTKNQAQQALADLPKKLQNNQVFVSKIAHIREKIEY
jgi:type II secretory pathway predicted ATPase ExeA